MARAVVYSRARGAPSDVLGGAARPYRGGRGGRARRRWRHGSPSPFSHSRRLTCSVPLCYVDRHVVYMARAVICCGVARGAPSDVLGGAARPRDGRARVSCASELATRLSFSVVPARPGTAGAVAWRCANSCRLTMAHRSSGGRPSRRLRRGGRALGHTGLPHARASRSSFAGGRAAPVALVYAVVSPPWPRLEVLEAAWAHAGWQLRVVRVFRRGGGP